MLFCKLMEEHRLRVFENKFLRGIFESKDEEGIELLSVYYLYLHLTSGRSQPYKPNVYLRSSVF
jgi:hypothetical protein